MQSDRKVKIGSLYFISSEEQLAVKVGFADDLALRLANLQTGNPAPLKIVFVHSATAGAERLLHSYLKPYRINREWYPDIWLLDDIYDALGYLLVDRAMEEAEEFECDYLECFERQFLTEADIDAVAPQSVAAYQAWLDAGSPLDPDEVIYASSEADKSALLAHMHGLTHQPRLSPVPWVRMMKMDDFDHIDEKLEAEIARAFDVAVRHWPRGVPTCFVERRVPTDNRAIFTTAVGALPSELMKWEFKRELVENVSGFPLTHYWLLCNGDWRLLAVHGRL